MYFQCDAGRGRRRLVRRAHLGRAADPARRRTASTLQQGPITAKTVLPFRSFVQRADAPRPAVPGRRRRAHRAADRRQGPEPGAGRRTGAGRGARAAPCASSDDRARSTPTATRALRAGLEGAALLLLDDDDAAPRRRAPAPFDVRRQIGELATVAGSRAGSTYLAEAYTGWPRRSPARHRKPGRVADAGTGVRYPGQSCGQIGAHRGTTEPTLETLDELKGSRAAAVIRAAGSACRAGRGRRP